MEYNVNFWDLSPFLQLTEQVKSNWYKIFNFDELNKKRNELIDLFVSKYWLKVDSKKKNFRFAKGFSLPKKEKLEEMEKITDNFSKSINQSFFHFNKNIIPEIEKLEKEYIQKINIFCNKNKINTKIKTFFIDLIILMFSIVRLIIEYTKEKENIYNNQNMIKTWENIQINKKNLLNYVFIFFCILITLYLLIKWETIWTLIWLLISFYSFVYSNNITKLEEKISLIDQKITNFENNINKQFKHLNASVEKQRILTKMDEWKITHDAANQMIRDIELRNGIIEN